VKENKDDLVSEILPLEVKKEIAPPFPALLVSEIEYANDPELMSEILPIEVLKEISPPFPALPNDDCE
jgi:hypothetical protein